MYILGQVQLKYYKFTIIILIQRKWVRILHFISFGVCKTFCNLDLYNNLGRVLVV